MKKMKKSEMPRINAVFTPEEVGMIDDMRAIMQKGKVDVVLRPDVVRVAVLDYAKRMLKKQKKKEEQSQESQEESDGSISTDDVE